MAGEQQPIDPLQALSAALAVPADSKEQAELLAALRESLEAHPGPIPILCTTLLKTVSAAGDSLLKRWVLDLLHFAICRSTLSIEARTQLASQSLEVLAALLNDHNPLTVKVVVQCFGTVYPLIFRLLCTNRNPRHQWDIVNDAKRRILEFVSAPNVPMGVRLAAIKFMQKAMLVQTRGGSDPRLIQLQSRNDPNISMCPIDHPFIMVSVLEPEGARMLEDAIKMLYTSQNPDILSAILNSWALLVKLRPALVEVVVPTLASWTPGALVGLPYAHIKSVEKGVRILLNHISRTQQNPRITSQIHAALQLQASRMEKAAAEEKQRKAAAAAAEASRKRSLSAAPDGPDTKRVKLEPEAPVASTSSASLLTGFDFTTLPASLVTDLIVANLQVISETTLSTLISTYIQKRSGSTPPAPSLSSIPAPPVPAPQETPTISADSSLVNAIAGPNIPVVRSLTPSIGPGSVSEPRKSRSASPSKEPEVKEEKEEPVDPLQMDIDQDDMLYEPEKISAEILGEQVSAAEGDMTMDNEVDLTFDLGEFKLPPPKDMSNDQRDLIIRNSLVRLWEGAKDLIPTDFALDLETQGVSGADMWMLLLIRLVTRVADPAPTPPDPGDEPMDTDSREVNSQLVSDIYAHQDRLRQTLCEYIMDDFPGRLRLATAWMNEEWYNDRIRRQQDPDWRPNYDTWLNQIVAMHQTHFDGKDKSFGRFLLDLPSVPQDVLSLLREMCVEPDRRPVGFAALREFVQQRPSLRSEAMTMLLELTTHSDKITRGAAINTVKRWIPDVQPMETMIRDFALQLLRRLQSRPSNGKKNAEAQQNGNGHDASMEDEEDGQLPQEDIIQTPYLPEQLELPAKDDQILQHLELLFALSTKLPEFLDELFAAYGGMEVTVQESIQRLITPLIRALGSGHGKLLTLLRTFPRGAETLALRVLSIFTENQRPSAQLVALVKGLLNDRELDPRFLIPIIAEMDKADILKHLPRIVSILNGQPEPKNLVKSVFNSIVTTPPQTFGSVTSNLPRVRQSELLTPAELMVLLHESEKEIGRRQAIEAIGICFSMTDIFRSEILGVVMNQLVDEPVLPTLFMRTVIQAVSTYRSLVGFVSTTLLSRLITKKIWQNPPLWEGFIRCAKQIAPSSFSALLQLPKDQLQELVDKQPTLKSGLREFVMKRNVNKARVAGLLDILGDESAPSSDTPPPTTPGTPAEITNSPVVEQVQTVVETSPVS
ncbi:hypothetical protein ABKN59_005891 [Abortiporus biennis]